MKFLKKDFGGMKVWMPLLAALVALIGLIIGSFLDLNITKAMYVGNNWWSFFVEFLGTLPSAIIIGTSGLFLYFYLDSKGYKKLKWVLGILAILVAGAYWGYDSFHRHDELKLLSKMYIYGPLGILVVSICESPFFFLLKNGDRSSYLKKALVILISLVAIFLLTFGVKYLNARTTF